MTDFEMRVLPSGCDNKASREDCITAGELAGDCENSYFCLDTGGFQNVPEPFTA